MRFKITTSYILFIAFMLHACQKERQSFDESLVFRYNESANVTSLDPAFAKTQSNIWLCNQLFNGLVQLNDSLEIQPSIARDWHISADGLTYTFNLRPDVYFHEHPLFGSAATRSVTAHDFVYSFDRLKSEKLAAPGGWILQNVASYKAIANHTFEIQLKNPFPGFLGLLTMQYAAVVPQEIAEHPNHDFRSHPIGTGPFLFKIWEENIKLVLRKNPNYFEKDAQGHTLPYLEAVSVSFLPDKQSGFLQFAQQKLDFVSGLDPSYKDEILTQKGTLQDKYKDRVTMISGPYLNTEYLGFRLSDDNSPIQDKHIRQALNYGFDRHKLVTYLRNNMGIPANSGMIPAGMPSYVPHTGYTYDPEKAKALIASYKANRGQNTPKITLSTNASYIDIAEFLQSEWQQLGLQITIDVNPPSTLRQAIATGKVPFFRASWIADYPDAENYLSLFYSKNFAPNGPNYTHFSNETFDALYEASFLVTEADKRYALYQKMDSIIIAEAPVIPLFYDKAARFTQNNVSGLGINPLNLLNLKHVKKTPVETKANR